MLPHISITSQGLPPSQPKQTAHIHERQTSAVQCISFYRSTTDTQSTLLVTTVRVSLTMIKIFLSVFCQDGLIHQGHSLLATPAGGQHQGNKTKLQQAVETLHCQPTDDLTTATLWLGLFSRTSSAQPVFNLELLYVLYVTLSVRVTLLVCG